MVKRRHPSVRWTAYSPADRWWKRLSRRFVWPLAKGDLAPDERPAKVRLSPDYSAPYPLWPLSDATAAMVPEAVMAKLVAWQKDFDANFHWETGWRSDEARDRWAAAATELGPEVRAALDGRAELEVDLWPLTTETDE